MTLEFWACLEYFCSDAPTAMYIMLPSVVLSFSSLVCSRLSKNQTIRWAPFLPILTGQKGLVNIVTLFQVTKVKNTTTISLQVFVLVQAAGIFFSDVILLSKYQSNPMKLFHWNIDSRQLGIFFHVIWNSAVSHLINWFFTSTVYLQFDFRQLMKGCLKLQQ